MDRQRVVAAVWAGLAVVAWAGAAPAQATRPAARVPVSRGPTTTEAILNGVANARPDELAHLLADPDPLVRRRALNVAGNAIVNEAAIEARVRQLAASDSYAGVRAAAVKLLSDSGCTMEVVILATRDPDAAVRNAAAGERDAGRNGIAVPMLFDHRDPRRLALSLIAALEHEEPFVRSEAARRLARAAHLLGDGGGDAIRAGRRRATDVLLADLRAARDDAARERAFNALWAFRPEARDAALALARDPSPALRLIGMRLVEADPEGARLRVRMLTDPDPTVAAAVKTEIRQLEGRGIDALVAVVDADQGDVRSAAAAALADLELGLEWATEALERHDETVARWRRHDVPEVRAAAAALTGRRPTVDTLPHVIAAAADPSPRVRAAAAVALPLAAQVDGPALDALIKLAADPDLDVRGRAVEEMGSGWFADDTPPRDVRRIVPVLVAALEDGELPREQKLQALVGLGQLGPDAAPALARLRALAAAPGDDGIGEFAQVTVESIESPLWLAGQSERIEKLKADLASPAAQTRVGAIKRLLAGPRLQMRIAVPPLLAALDDTDPDVVTAAAHGLQVLRSFHEPVRGLLEAGRAAELRLDDADPAVRRAAIDDLAKLGLRARSAAPAVLKRFQNDTDPSVRDAARQALRAIWGDGFGE